MTEKEPHLSTEEARAGATRNVTRVVLTVSLILVIIVFGFLFWNA